LQATLAALESPITYTNKVSPAIPVTVVNGKTGKQTTNKVTTLGFNPALTTPTAVLAIVSARIPNFDPALISNAVAATMLFTTNTNGVVFPIWGPQPAAASVNKITNAVTQSQTILTLNEKTETTQINNSAAVAKAALTAAVKAYAAGTKQWATFKASTGPTNGVTYLPNFGSKPLGPTGNPQAPDYKGLANAAAAVAANAINGLGSFNTNSSTNTSGLYGQTQANVTKLTTSLTQAALAYQTISTPTGTNSTKGYVSGALGAETLGLVTQVAGVNDTEWASAPTASLLQGIVSGAVAAVGKTSANLTFVATGIAQGFYATYLETTTDNPPMTPNQFAGISSVITTNGPVTFNNANDIIAAFKLAGVTQTELTKLGLNTVQQFSTYFNNVSTAISSGTNGVWANTISGAPGINLGGTNTPLLNAVGTPVTDTIGL